MPDRKPSTLPFETGDPAEQALWSALADLPRGEPGPGLRRQFYHGLEQAHSQRWTTRLRNWLGLRGNAGWITATACVLIGFGLAQTVDRQAGGAGPERLVALEDSVAQLKRELILDRLQDDSAATRLKGVVEAGQMVQTDREVARALLARATQDRSPSVRSAAVDALAPELRSQDVGSSLMNLLKNAESPLVQLALVDLVLRHGSSEQVHQLQQLADSGRLYPDLAQHVRQALGSQSI